MVLVIDFRFAALTCKVSGGTAVFDAWHSKTGCQHVAGPRALEAVAARRASLSDALEELLSFVTSRKRRGGSVMQSEAHHNGIGSFRKLHWKICNRFSQTALPRQVSDGQPRKLSAQLQQLGGAPVKSQMPQLNIESKAQSLRNFRLT
jgi:hypothetical protein